MGRPPRQSLTSMLVEAVTERIRSGQYKRGDQVPTEKALIEEFAVSRTVVAIANLNREPSLVGLFNYLGEVLMTRAQLSISRAQQSMTPNDLKTLREFHPRISSYQIIG